MNRLGIEPFPHSLTARYIKTLPIDVYECTVANNVFIYLSKLAMELNLIAIEALCNCSGALVYVTGGNLNINQD